MTTPNMTIEPRAQAELTGLILVESDDLWVLTERFDPRLTLGSVFELAGQRWTVTWESDHGFGPTSVN